jgi:hypothetical protein
MRAVYMSFARPASRLAVVRLTLLLVVTASAGALLQGGCGGAGPSEVPLAVLAAEPRSFDGRLVRTRGVVRSVEEPLHYWIEDADFNRVQLVPPESAEPYLGRDVLVSGRFSYAQRAGRRIEVEDIVAPAQQ